MRPITLAILFFAALCPQIIRAAGQPILFIFDASGSMAAPFQGVTRMTAARVMLGEQLRRLPIGTAVGLVAYGNGIPGCESYRLYAPVARASSGSILSAIDKLVASGESPIAATLRRAAQILAKEKAGRIILISDGKETCGGDPETEATILRKRGFSTFVIGLAPDESTALYLAGIASAGGGRFFNAQSSVDFINAIQASTDFRDQGPGRKGAWEDPDEPRDSRHRAEETVETATQAGPGITIRATQFSRVDGRARIEIEYEFRADAKKDYLVVFNASFGQIFPLATAAATHYDSETGRGALVIELDPAPVGPETPLLQGELWKIDQTPEFVSKSNTLRLRAE